MGLQVSHLVTDNNGRQRTVQLLRWFISVIAWQGHPNQADQARQPYHYAAMYKAPFAQAYLPADQTLPLSDQRSRKGLGI